MFVPLVLRIPSRSTDVRFAIQFGRREWKGNEEKEWSFRTITNLGDISGKKNYCPDFELRTMRMDVYLYKCENTRRILSLSAGGGGW